MTPWHADKDLATSKLKSTWPWNKILDLFTLKHYSPNEKIETQNCWSLIFIIWLRQYSEGLLFKLLTGVSMRLRRYVWLPWWWGMEAVWAFTVIPRSRSTWSLSSTWAFFPVDEITPGTHRQCTMAFWLLMFYKNTLICFNDSKIISYIVVGFV